MRTSFRSGQPPQQPRWQSVNQTVTGRTDPDRICTIEFEIPNNLPPPVFFYYRLTNFYQNHRRYVKSVEERQLKGEAVSLGDLQGSDSCNPLISDSETNKPYFPCGLIANSLFNDTYTHPLWITATNGADNETYFMTDKGIAWASDRERYKKSTYANSDVMPPPNWRVQYPDGYTDQNPIPDLSQREDFQVWMRTAGLPTFSKLAKKNTTSPMMKGTYFVNITDSALYHSFFPFQILTIITDFNVKLYGGTKSIVISTTTVMGGKNPFLGIAYIVVGGLCVLLGAIFAVRHLFKPRLVTVSIFLPPLTPMLTFCSQKTR